jgi:hypothetical protein
LRAQASSLSPAARELDELEMTGPVLELSEESTSVPLESITPRAARARVAQLEAQMDALEQVAPARAPRAPRALPCGAVCKVNHTRVKPASNTGLRTRV